MLCFAPHPDDEVIGPGGALALHRAQGDPVMVVVATDGTAGDPDGRFEASEYAELRRSESRAGLKVLGIDDAHFLGFEDSHVLTENDIQRGVAAAMPLLTSYAPDVVYAPWVGERNPDHHALHVVVRRALAEWGGNVTALGYEVWDTMMPDYLLDVTSVFDQKLEALRCHQSQLAYVDYERAVAGLGAYRSVIHMRGAGQAEAYCALDSSS